MLVAKLLFTLAIKASLLSGFLYTSQVLALNQKKQYSATFVNVPPIIDGELSDEIWLSAKNSSPFILHQNGSKGKHNTHAKIVYDSSFIYLAFIVSDDDIVANFTKNQSFLFQQDDVIEMFIDPLGAGKPYFELGISPSNVFYSLKIDDPKISSFQSSTWLIKGFESATKVNGTINESSDVDQGWQVEIKIPLNAFQDALSKKTKREFWRFNLFRIDYSGNLPRQANEYYSWSTVGSFGFHQPAKFGYLMFK